MFNDAPQNRTPFHQFEVGFDIIIDLITPGTRVLDLGCGSGTLLQRLRDEKEVEGCGVELDQAKVIRCIERGIRVMSLDLDQGLEGFPDFSYEYVVSQPNSPAAHESRAAGEGNATCGIQIYNRFSKFRSLEDTSGICCHRPHSNRGRVSGPRYNSPDIHRITINDFRDFVNKIGARIEREIFITENVSRPNIFWPNRRSEWGCFQISGA